MNCPAAYQGRGGLRAKPCPMSTRSIDLGDGFDSWRHGCRCSAAEDLYFEQLLCPVVLALGWTTGAPGGVLLHLDLYSLASLGLRLRDVHGQDSIPALGTNAARIGVVRQR